MSEQRPSKDLVTELRATNNRPELAQIYLRHLCLRAAAEIERMENVTTLRDQIDSLMAEVSRLAAENFRLRTAHEPCVGSPWKTFAEAVPEQGKSVWWSMNGDKPTLHNGYDFCDRDKGEWCYAVPPPRATRPPAAAPCTHRFTIDGFSNPLPDDRCDGCGVRWADRYGASQPPLVDPLGAETRAATSRDARSTEDAGRPQPSQPPRDGQ